MSPRSGMKRPVLPPLPPPRPPPPPVSQPRSHKTVPPAVAQPRSCRTCVPQAPGRLPQEAPFPAPDLGVQLQSHCSVRLSLKWVLHSRPCSPCPSPCPPAPLRWRTDAARPFPLPRRLPLQEGRKAQSTDGRLGELGTGSLKWGGEHVRDPVCDGATEYTPQQPPPGGS